MKARNFGLGYVRTLFFISSVFIISCGLYLILLGIFATRDFTESILLKALIDAVAIIKKLIPHVIAGMTPPVKLVPISWLHYTYHHAFLTLFFFTLGGYLWNLQKDIGKRKPPARLIAMVFCFFYSFFYLFLLLLWTGGTYGPLMLVICLPVILIFFFTGVFLNNNHTKALFAHPIENKAKTK